MRSCIRPDRQTLTYVVRLRQTVPTSVCAFASVSVRFHLSRKGWPLRDMRSPHIRLYLLVRMMPQPLCVRLLLWISARRVNCSSLYKSSFERVTLHTFSSISSNLYKTCSLISAPRSQTNVMEMLTVTNISSYLLYLPPYRESHLSSEAVDRGAMSFPHDRIRYPCNTHFTHTERLYRRRILIARFIDTTNFRFK